MTHWNLPGRFTSAELRRFAKVRRAYAANLLVDVIADMEACAMLERAAIEARSAGEIWNAAKIVEQAAALRVRIDDARELRAKLFDDARGFLGRGRAMLEIEGRDATLRIYKERTLRKRRRTNIDRQRDKAYRDRRAAQRDRRRA